MEQTGTRSFTNPGASPEQPSFKCTDCSTSCTQKQTLTRHYREKHQPGLRCLEHDCDYKWTQSRKSEYRKHLRKQHGLEDDKINKILGPPRRLGKSSAIKSDPPPLSPPPPIERDVAEPQQRPPMLPVLAAGKDVHHASSPPVPPVLDLVHNARLLRAEPEIVTTEREDSSELEHLAATHVPSRLLLPEEFALLVRHYKVYRRFRFPSSHPGRSTTADPMASFSQQQTFRHVGPPAIAPLMAPTQQPGMEGPQFSSGIPVLQASHPAPPPPTQKMPTAAGEAQSCSCHALKGTIPIVAGSHPDTPVDESFNLRCGGCSVLPP